VAKTTRKAKAKRTRPGRQSQAAKLKATIARLRRELKSVSKDALERQTNAC
jgi:hypothetical protein